MALEVGASHATAHVNGSTTPSLAEDEELYEKLLRLRDVVIAGKHAFFKLPDIAVAELRAALIPRNAEEDGSVLPQFGGAINGSAFTTNQTQPQQSSSFPKLPGLPGLQASSAHFHSSSSPVFGTTPAPAATLDPIFLEKSAGLVRAEGQLKRQRLDRELQLQLDQKGKPSSRDKDQATDALSTIDVDLVYLSALERVKPVSGLRETDKPGSAASSSFDENDYYSSLVESDWSSEASSSRVSDRAEVAFTADFERLDSGTVSSIHKKRPSHGKAQAIPGSSYVQPALVDSQDDEYEPGEVFEIEDEDDDYTPPDASAFDSPRNYVPRPAARVVTTPDDDNSDYEPGEIMDSNIPTPVQPKQQPAQKSPNVQIVRNHLTHLAAPQPNRVSPLATAKGPSIELELVNGRPEVVRKPASRSNYAPSRVTSVSPPSNGVNNSAKKRRSKKRKRDNEPTGRSKRRREKQPAFDEQYDQEQYIKDEPISPPPFSSVPEAPQHPPQYVQSRPSNLDLSASRPAPQYHHAPEPSRSGLRYEHTSPATPTVVRVASPAYRPLHRDTQDLRRAASLHQAHRLPASPRAQSPTTPYRTVSMTYGNPRMHQPPRPAENGVPQYVGATAQDIPQYPRAERSRSPPRVSEYRDTYAERVASPSLMPPPPAAPPRRFIVDQYGRKYYAEEPAPPPTSALLPRATVAPTERQPQPGPMYQDALRSRSTAFAQYEPVDTRMAPPPSRSQVVREHPPEYVDANGYPLRSYYPRPAEPLRYAPAPTSPVYQEIRGYDQMQPPPLPAPAREPTSPVYAPRSYSVRPEEPPQPTMNYIRHTSVAPPQFVRQDAPPPPQMRAASVMPGLDYSSSAPTQRAYTQAPQSVRYIDRNGNEVFPSQVRQVSEFRYQ